ncbi:MAG TPA: hypothetical protein VFN59_01530 [Acidimicrobiales bacterium]|nr:hypothetical protein [Acidimicrobiales bacterium]
MRTRQALLDEIALREASLHDARRELAAGELGEVEAAALLAREETVLARLRAELAAAPGASEVARPARRRRRGLLLVALGCFVVAIVAVLVAALGPRQPGTSITGGVALSRGERVTQLLDEAQADVANGQDAAALAAYLEVLALSPHDATAATQAGWLEFSAGSARHDAALVATGVRELTRALEEHPRDPAPRLYYAIVADSTPHGRALARREFRIFLALHPSAGELAVARPFLVALGLRP